MKKITFALLALLGFQEGNYAQNIVAPPNVGGNSAFRAPNGTQDHAYMRSLFYISPSELLPLNLATISSCSFQVLNGTGGVTPATGNFTMYLANTDDQLLQVGANFNTEFSSMTQVYAGPYTIPTAAGPSTVPVVFNSSFNYTGGGLLVGYSYEGTVFSANSATYASSYYFAAPSGSQTEQWLYNASSSVAPMPTNAQVASNFRPSIIWGAVNTATNEVELFTISAPGKVSNFINATQNFSAEVLNSNSSGAQFNLTVAVNGVGANPFMDTVVIPSLSAGAKQAIAFKNYNPTAKGVTDFTFAVLTLDEMPANNIKTWSQEVTCDAVGLHPSDMTYNNGYYGAGIWSSKHNFPIPTTLTGVKMAIGSHGSGAGKSLHAALVGPTGNTIAIGSAVNIVPSTTVTFNFDSPQTLTPNTDYYIGVYQPSATAAYYSIAYSAYTPQIAPDYYRFPLGGAVPSPETYFGYFSIEPQLEFPDLQVTAAASKTFVCTGDTISFKVTGGPGMSYNWNPSAGDSAVVTMTLAPIGTQTSSLRFVEVVGTHTATGCASKNAVVTVSVGACNTNTVIGIQELADYSSIFLYPNPAVNGQTKLNGLQGENLVEVSNIMGQVVIRKMATGETEDIDLSDLSAGQYLIKVSNSREQAKVFKVIKN